MFLYDESLYKILPDELIKDIGIYAGLQHVREIRLRIGRLPAAICDNGEHMGTRPVDERLTQFERFMNGEVVGQKKFIRNFSAGNKQKIGIISAMLHYPQLLILDEPFNFLDPSSQSVIKHLLKKYNEEHNATVIISSHNLNHTVDVCPRIALLEHGVIIRDIQNENNSAEKELEDYFNVNVDDFIQEKEVANPETEETTAGTEE